MRPRPSTTLTNVTLADLGELLLPIFHLLQDDQWRISLAMACKTLCTEQRRLRPPVNKQISVWSTRTKASDAGWRVPHIVVNETNPNRPASTDILLADIVMEGIDGFEVVRTVMTDPELADVSIAILSGLPADELAARGGVPAGVVFFPKPINYDELRGYLRASVAQRARKPAPV